MKLKDIALLTEIVGGVGILISLVVLVLEVRQNTALVERQILLDRSNWVAQIIDSPYIAPIFAKIKAIDDDIVPTERAFMEQYDLTFEEATRFTTWLRQMWSGFQAEFETGTPGLDEIIKDILQHKDQELFWMNTRSTYTADFVNYVNDLTE